MKTPSPLYFIIAGVNRAGTTSVFQYLSDHDAVCGSSIKETLFFSDHYSGNRKLDLNRYDDYFKHYHQNHKIKMEASPCYLYNEEIPSRIKDLLPNSKLLFILRDPIERAFSSFARLKSRYQIPQELTFDELVNVILNNGNRQGIPEYALGDIDRGNYGKYLKKYSKVFSKEDLKIMFFENLGDGPRHFTMELCGFLGIDGSFYREYDFHTVNARFDAKNKHLHRLAISLNRKFEPFLRHRYSIKRPLVSLYKKINKQADEDETFSKKTLEMLRSYYEKDRKILVPLLEDFNLTVPGNWT